MKPDDFDCEDDFKAERTRRRIEKKENKLWEIEEGIREYDRIVNLESENSDSDDSRNNEIWSDTESEKQLFLGL